MTRSQWSCHCLTNAHEGQRHADAMMAFVKQCDLPASAALLVGCHSAMQPVLSPTWQAAKQWHDLPPHAC
jgi:hypothetical protein